MKLFDSHLHLSDDAFAADRDAVVARARRSGVAGLVTVASNPADARAALQVARSFPGVWATAGLHPHEARNFSAEVVEGLRDLLHEPEVVAVGETGLDFHYDHSPRAAQEEAFEAQLSLAAEAGLPVVVHSRSADADTIRLLRRWEGRVTGVLHCFSGGRELLEAGLAAGWCVSFSGMVTFRNYDGADLVRRVPSGRLLVETDSPYLAPVPHRGRRNEPAHLVHTCRALAAIRGVAETDVARQTYENACGFYGVARPA